MFGDMQAMHGKICCNTKTLGDKYCHDNLLIYARAGTGTYGLMPSLTQTQVDGHAHGNIYISVYIICFI